MPFSRLLALLFALCLTALPAMADRITVFAAASLTGALNEVAQRFEEDTGHDVVVSFAGTSALARQISQGAPADVFISANKDWMDALASEGLVVPGTRFDLAGNRLVLIASAGGQIEPVPLDDVQAALRRLGDGRLAMALIEAVPAGIYGKAALETLGLWQSVEGRVAQTDNVRAALALVAVGAAPFGIVYASDAQVEDRVRIVATFPAASHPPIRYPAAAIAGRDTVAVRNFLTYLRGPQAQAILRRHGFTPVEG